MARKKITKRKICIVLVVDDLGYGGAERQVVELSNNMDANKFDVHVCSLSTNIPLAEILKDKDHKLHVIKKYNKFDFTIIPRLAYLLKMLKADIVHGYHFGAQIASSIAGCIAGTQLVVGSERNANRKISKRNILIEKLTRRCVDIIVANSNAGAKSNSKVFNRSPSEYRIVYNGVNTEWFRIQDKTVIRQKLEIPIECPVIGVFANFKKQKNHKMLFCAFKLVLKSFPQTKLLIIGDQIVDKKRKSNKYQIQMNELVNDLGIRHQCIFLGHRLDVDKLYAACDITVLSSLHEGTPNVLLESMACGVPVIATNVCDNEYIVRDGEVGHLVQVGDEKGMAYHIVSLLGNDALRQKMGQKARDWVLKEFSNKQLARRMEAVYMELVKKKTQVKLCRQDAIKHEQKIL